MTPSNVGQTQSTGAGRMPPGVSVPKSRLRADARELCHWAMDLAWYGAIGTVWVTIIWAMLVMAFGVRP